MFYFTSSLTSHVNLTKFETARKSNLVIFSISSCECICLHFVARTHVRSTHALAQTHYRCILIVFQAVVTRAMRCICKNRFKIWDIGESAAVWICFLTFSFSMLIVCWRVALATAAIGRLRSGMFSNGGIPARLKVWSYEGGLYCQ